MSQIDSSIYMNQQTPDFLGNVQKGMQLSQMHNENQAKEAEGKKKKAIDSAISGAMNQNPDGSFAFDKNAALSSIGKLGYGADTLDMQNKFQQQDFNKQKQDYETQTQHIDMLGRKAAGVIANPTLYPQLKMEAEKSGWVKPGELPDQYDEKVMMGHLQSLYAGKGSLKDQYEASNLKNKMDPNSQESKNAQQIFQGTFGKQYNPDQISKMSANDVESAMKPLEVKSKLDEQAVKNRTLNFAKDQAMSDRKTSINQKYADGLKKDLDADAGRTGNFGSVSKKVMQAQNLETLANAFPDGNLDSRQVEELSLGLANMLAGSGGTSRAQVEGLIPHTWSGKAANVQEWITSDPKGAGQQEFVKRMMHTIEREKETSLNQLNSIREQRLSSHKNFSKSDPEAFKSIVKSYGMDPENYDDNLLPKNKKAVKAESGADTAKNANFHPQASDAFTWAKQNPDDPRAKEIMKRIGQ